MTIENLEKRQFQIFIDKVNLPGDRGGIGDDKALVVNRVVKNFVLKNEKKIPIFLNFYLNFFLSLAFQ